MLVFDRPSNDLALCARIEAPYARKLEDGRIVAVQPLTYGKGRVTLSPNEHWVDDGW